MFMLDCNNATLQQPSMILVSIMQHNTTPMPACNIATPQQPNIPLSCNNIMLHMAALMPACNNATPQQPNIPIPTFTDT